MEDITNQDSGKLPHEKSVVYAVMNMPAIDVKEKINHDIEIDDSEYAVSIEFDDLLHVLVRLDEMRGNLEGIDSILDSCPECVEITNLDLLEQAFNNAIDIFPLVDQILHKFHSSHKRNRRLSWLLRKIHERSGELWRQVSVNDLVLSDGLGKRLIEKNIKTLNGLSEMHDVGKTLKEIGISKEDEDELKESLRVLLRGIRCVLKHKNKE